MRTLILAALLLATPAIAAELPKTRAPIGSFDAGDDSGAAREIVALVDRLAQAIQSHDSATLSRLIVPDGVMFDTRDNPDGTTKIGRHTLAEWVGIVGGLKQQSEERIGRPDITIAGAAASASAPYTFYIDGKVHHCGTDFFQFVRDGGTWKIVAVTYNSTTVGCAG